MKHLVRNPFPFSVPTRLAAGRAGGAAGPTACGGGKRGGFARRAAVAALAAGMLLAGAGEAKAWGSNSSVFNSYIVANGDWLDGSGEGHDDFNGHDFGAVSSLMLGGQVKSYFAWDGNNGSSHVHGGTLNYYGRMGWRVSPRGDSSVEVAGGTLTLPFKQESGNDDQWEEITTCNDVATGLPAGSYQVEVWFYVADPAGENGFYDSNGGANYKACFTIMAVPEVWATGVDATSYLLNWSETADRYQTARNTSDSHSYSTTTKSYDFSSWATGTRSSLFYTNDYCRMNEAYIYGDSSTKVVWLSAPGSFFETEWIPGAVTQVTYSQRGAGTTTIRSVDLQYSTNGTDWVTINGLTNNTQTYTSQSVAPSSAIQPGPNGVKFRWLNTGSSGRTSLVKAIGITYLPTVKGHSQSLTGTSGTLYCHEVKTPGAANGGTLPVRVGVMPSEAGLNGCSTNFLTFRWTGHANATGYKISWSTNAAGDIVTAESAHETSGRAWPRECDATNAPGDGQFPLTTNGAFSAKGWRYWGTACQKDGAGAFNQSAPAYKDAIVSSTHHTGHYLVGDTVMGIESTNFPIAGATTLKFSYTIKAWNLNSVGASLENGRVNAYYRLDDGPWCFLGTGVPSGTTDGNGALQAWTLEKGMLDGTNIAFRIELANGAVGYFTSDTAANKRMAGVYVQALKVYCTAKGEGGYNDGNAASAVPGGVSGAGTKTYTVGGLAPETPVYFRVQALQGADTANPTARSVWVETKATSLVERVVAFTAASATGVTAGRTAAVGVTVSQDENEAAPTITYTSSDTTKATVDSDGTVHGLAAGTVTITATAGATAHYADGVSATHTITVRPARPTAQATLELNTAAGTRTPTAFSLDFTRGGGTGVLVLVKQGGWPNDPTDGVGVANVAEGGSALTATTYGDACAVVNAAYADNTSRTKPVTGATAGSHYYARAFTFNHTGTVDAGNQTYSYMTPGAGIDFWTLAAEPGTAATVGGAKAAVDGDKNAVITYDAQGAGNVLLVMMPASGATAPPAVDGTSYAAVASTTYGTASAALGAGYVIYAGAAGSGSQTLNVDGLSGGTSYVVYAFPYNTGAGDTSGTSANYRAATQSAAFATEAAQGPENLSATTTRYTISASWDAMAPPAGKTVTGYTVEATACGGDGTVSAISTCPDGASLPDTYDPTKATHGSTTAWSYRWSVKSASDATHSYPGWNVNGQAGHELLGRWTSTTHKPGLESPRLNLGGAASAVVQFDFKKYNSGTLHPDRSRVALLYSLDGGATWLTGPTSGDGPASFTTTNLPVPSEALADGVKLMLFATNTAGYTENGSAKVVGPVVKAVSVIQTAKATGDYAGTGCPVPAADIAVSGTTATITGLASGQFHYYRVKADFSDGTSSHWTEAGATTKGPMASPGASASAGRYDATVAWTAPDGESANVTAWHVQVTRCTSGGADEPTTNACPNGALAYAVSPSADAWTYTNRAGGYPSWDTYKGYNGGAHVLSGTGENTFTPKGVVSEQLNLSGTGSAFVRFMHAPLTQSPIDRSYITLYYSLDDGASWTKAETLADAGQVYPSQVYKALSIRIPDAALAEGVYLKLSADSACRQVTSTATNLFGARLADIEVVATPLRQDWDFACAGTLTSDCTSPSAAQKAAMDHTFGGLDNATTYGYRVWATDEGGNASATNTGQFTTLAGQAPPVQVWADPVKQTQMKLQWEAATASYSEVDAPEGDPAAQGWYVASGGGYAPATDTSVQEGTTYYAKSGTDATGYEIQMTQCVATEWERVAIAASPTNARLGSLDDWSYIGGGTDVEAVEGVKLSETTYITAGGVYPTWADGTAGAPENSQVLAGEGEPGMMSAVFSTVGATNATLSFNFGRWYVKGGLQHVDAAAASNAAVLTAYYSLDGGESWENWFKTESATNYPYTYKGTYGSARRALPPAALGQERVRIKLVAEDACIMDVSTRAGSSYVTNHAVGVAVALAKVTLQGVTGDYASSGCRVDDGTWTVPATAEELSLLVTGLEAGSNYCFRVRATDGATDPAQYGAWTDGAAATLAAPDKVTNLVSSAIGRYAFTVGWDASARSESYIAYVYRDGSLQGTYPTDGLSVRVTGLSANTTYTVKVVAVADGVAWDGIPAGEPDTTSDALSVTTANAISIGGLEAKNIDPTGMTIVWDGAGSGASGQNVLTWGEVGGGDGSGPVEEVLACPADTLKRTDSGNGWYYVGGSASYPAYWKGSDPGDEGHALIYAAGGYPGIRSRWFDTFGATNVTVEFLHGRFNAAANSAVELDYSLDGGETWTYAGETETSSATTPTQVRKLALPAAALNRKSVMIQLTAPNADGNKGAHVKDLKIRIQGERLATGGGSKTWTGAVDTQTTSWPLAGLTPGKRYWFTLDATDDGTTWVHATNTASTYAMRTGVLASQGFEDATTDTAPWSWSVRYIRTDGDEKTAWEPGFPVVEVVENENPLHGRKALRMSGSTLGSRFGVVDFTYQLGNRGGVVTIPFSAKDLAKNDYLYVSYKWSDSASWVAPGGTNQTSMDGIPLTRIGAGGSDVLNQNWPYNRGLNATTRPKGDAYSFEVPAGSAGATLTVRVAFCGQSGGANRQYFIDEVSLEEAAGIPDPVSATANDQGTVDLAWTSPAGQKVIVIRGQDMRNPPAAGAPDLSALPEGYEVVMNGTDVQWPAGAGTFRDEEATGGWRYYYYFYAVTASGTIGKTPAVAYAMVKGMVKAIASQGWDGWDVHPWDWTPGRVTNPGRSSDAGWWKANGMNGTDVAFIPEAGESDADGVRRPSTSEGWAAAPTYASIYGQGGRYGTTGYADPDATKQQGVSTYTNYYGEHSYRFSGGGGYVWPNTHTYVDFAGNTVTATNPIINTNNVALEFANVDLSGYKNVEFQMHYAGPLQGGGNYLHLAISTNGGASGTWQAVDNLNSAGWRVKSQGQDYGLQVQEMYSGLTDAKVDFYDQTLAQYGNPFILQVPDNVTQFAARVMFYDSNGRTAGAWRNAAIFLDEVRLLGEVALETPAPVVDNIASNGFRVAWTNVPGADRYNLKVTAVASNEAVKLAESFAVQGTLDWTATGTVAYLPAANRQGGDGKLGYGLVLDADGEALASPAIGCAETLSFWAGGAGDTTAELSVQIGSGGTWETLWSATAAQILGGTGAAERDGAWSRHEIALPHRQWQQIRFVKTAGSGQVWVDDIQVLGAGNYATTVFARTGLAATNCQVTGLESGTRYFVSVQAAADVSEGGETHEITSPWGETADYTAGEFHALADGFELVRMGWGNPGSGIVVIAVTNGEASAVSTPAKDATLAVGTQVVAGSAVVVANATAAESGFEHVRPYKGDGAAGQYVAFWKHGNYWEGRLETNVALGAYVCQAADAFAVTNETFVAGDTSVSSPAATPFSGGTGWDGDWQLTATHGNGGWNAAAAVRDGTPEGLLETNQLWGAGGNMLKLMPGGSANGQKVVVRRKLATALPATGTWWGMFTMKVSHPSDKSRAGMWLLDANGEEKVSIGNVWYNNSSSQSAAGIVDATAYAVGANNTYVYVFKWDGAEGKMSLYVQYVGDATTLWDPSVAADLAAPDNWSWTVKDKAVSGMADIAFIALGAQNGTSGEGGYVGDVWFDEVRIGPDWPSLIGKQELPPLPAYDLEAVPDGNEMVRLRWKYKPGGRNADGSDNPLREHANGAVVLETSDENGFTDAEIAALRGAAPGTTSGNATVIARSDVATDQEQATDEMDHVVMPGTVHRYAVVTRNGSAYANAVTSGVVAMGTYGEREWVNPFSYTNAVEFASAYPADWATTYQGTWKGGHGFETGLTQHYWAKGGSGTWTPVKPSVADAAVHITNAIANYPVAAGNVMAFVPGDQASGYLKRNLNSAWCGNVGDTFYVAFRMAYRWNGFNKWAGLRVIDNGGNGAHGVLFGKVGTAAAAAGIAGVPTGSSSEGNWAGAAGSLDDYGNSSDPTHAYLVVGKVQWTASGVATASLYALPTGAGGATLPAKESDVAWQVTQAGLQLRNVNQFQLEAGATSGNGDIGTVYFDEIRFGTAWDDILGPADPTDVRMALVDGSDPQTTATTAWKGDFVSFDFESTPDGKKQTAAGWLTFDAGTTWTATAVATNVGTDTGWVQWRATDVQLTAAGGVRAGGGVAGATVEMKSWERAENARRYRAYEVRDLQPPRDIHPEGGVLRNLFDWTQWTDSPRTFEQVMVVRFETAAARAAWTPEDGTAYAQGVAYNGGKVVYVGTETNCVDTGLARNQEYWYAFYTVNFDHYSPAAALSCATLDEDPSVPTVDGDPTDWVGIPSETKNSATTSEGEWIWTDKVGEERKDTDACQSADLKEFRVKADAQNVYFLLRLSGGEGTASRNVYAAVALTTSGLDTGNADGEKWIGAPGNTLMGGAYWQGNASLHCADREMAVHWVDNAEEGRKWQVELWDKNGGHWYAATNWAAAGSADGAGDACIEWFVPRDQMGLAWTAANCMTGRFTVATFVNSGAWNNEGAGTAQIGDNGKCRAVDAMAIAPYGVNDKDLALGAWEEGLREKEVPFWADVRFDSAGVHANEAPSRPGASGWPKPNDESPASPEMTWGASRDEDAPHYEGFVTGYFLEVSTNATYNGVGDGTENGPVACRVNLEGADATGYRFVTDGGEYWWRVRARDNSGELSSPGAWHYVVVGKKDNAGPVAKLLYVGTNVMQFLDDPAYRADEEKSGDATSVLDSELEDGGHNFGFVIEWTDASGVYAMNKMRAWETGDPAWPDSSKPVGSFAWNVYATHDGHPDYPFGRVSPNWDLLIVDRNTPEGTSPAPSETVDGITHAYVWTNALVLPTEDGGRETVACWFIDCGFDTVFWENEMVYNGNTGTTLTNFVTNAFSISTYRPGTELYLTVSAEDCCTDTGDAATSGDAGWYGWPWWNRDADPDDPGSWKGIAKEYRSRGLSGWCADGPHMGRNVTTNQLLKFYVRDNDVIPPVASTEKWKDDAENAAGEKCYPFMAAARGSRLDATGWDPTWENLSSDRWTVGLLPVVEGIGRGATYQLTDADLAEGGKLRFFFNVHDEYIHSGVKRGTGDPDESVTKVSPPSTRALTNSAFFTRTWDGTAAEGAGAWVEGPRDRAHFKAEWSKVYDLTENEENEFVETAGTEGTGPRTVLAWEFDASVGIAKSLFARADLFDCIATHPEGVTNRVFLEAWDSDNNGEGDQAHDEIEFGRLVLRDDDTTPPTAPGTVTVTVGGKEMTADHPVWTNRIASISLAFAAARDPDTVADGMHERDTRGSGVASYRVAAMDETGTGAGTEVAATGSETLSATLAEGAGIAEGLATNYLFAVDGDADREDDALAGEAAKFVTAYDKTPPTSAASLLATTEDPAVTDPTSMMKLAWVPPSGGMGPDDIPGEIDKYSPWESYKVYFTTYTPDPDCDGSDPLQNDGNVSTAIEAFGRIGGRSWPFATATTNTSTGAEVDYTDLLTASTTSFTLPDLEPGENYIFAIVGLDKAGNESATPRFAVGDTIKFMVTQGVMRAWGTVSNELNTAALGAKIFTPSNNAGLRATPALYWDARINTDTHRATRGYSLVYRDGTRFEEGTNLVTRSGKRGWGDIAGNSISNNFYAEPDGDAQKLGRGRMRFYRATYAGREFATNGVVPLASEEVYALHNVKLSEGRNFVALHGVPYTNTFRGVFGCDTNYWPCSQTMGAGTTVEFYGGRSAGGATASGIFAFGLEKDGQGVVTNVGWYQRVLATNDGTVSTNYAEVTDVEQPADFFTSAFAIDLPKRTTENAHFYSDRTVAVQETVNGYQTSAEAHVFDWSPVLQMPTNDAVHPFSATVNCGTQEVKKVGRIAFTNLVGVDTLVAFRAPVSAHPKDLGLPLVAGDATTADGFVYNAAHPATGDRLLIWAPAVKDARFNGDETDCGDKERPLTAMSQMYYHCTNAATGEGLWRWYDTGSAADPAVTGKPIKPNDAIVIRSFNGGTHTNWTWSYTPTNLYPAADRHFGH